MMRITACFLVILALNCSPGRNSSDVWKLMDTEGEITDLTEDPSYLVIMSIAPDCPLSQLYAKSFTALWDTFPDFHFIGYVPGTDYDNSALRQFKSAYEFGPRIFLDEDYDLSKALNAEVTPQFFVINPGKEIVYSGAMDDWAIDLARKKVAPKKHYLKKALREISNENEISLAETKPVGCIIEYHEE